MSRSSSEMFSGSVKHHDGAFRENSLQLKAVKYFGKKALS